VSGVSGVPDAPGVTAPLSAPSASPAAARPVLAAVAHVPGGDDVPAEHAGPFLAALDQTLARGASDLLFAAGNVPLMRVDGELLECHGILPIAAEAIHAFFDARVPPSRRAHLAQTGSADFALVHQGGPDAAPVRFRVNLFRHAAGVSAALRPIWTVVPTLSDLRLPPGLTQLVELRHGLVLVTGATGSGKSTTLAALLEHVNRSRAAHIVTLEDPIEYAYQRQRAVIHQREVGQHVDSFASGLRAALRENPDVLLVGEMRDAETIRLALTAAQTGHLVLSTLHSGSAAMAVERVLDAFSEGEKVHVRQEVAATLRHVVAQQLVPAAGGGRVPALEMLTVNHAVASQIREGRTHMLATAIEVGGEDGMVSMPRALADLVRGGRVARAAAFAACDNREALERFLDERAAARLR
jgi:twitching motility protein PilT